MFFLFVACFNSMNALWENKKKTEKHGFFLLFSLRTNLWIVALLLLSHGFAPCPGQFPEVEQVRKYGTYHGAQKEAKPDECPSRVC